MLEFAICEKNNKKVLTYLDTSIIFRLVISDCALSSVGQSNRLITGGSKVRILEGAPIKYG